MPFCHLVDISFLAAEGASEYLLHDALEVRLAARDCLRVVLQPVYVQPLRPSAERDSRLPVEVVGQLVARAHALEVVCGKFGPVHRDGRSPDTQPSLRDETLAHGDVADLGPRASWLGRLFPVTQKRLTHLLLKHRSLFPTFSASEHSVPLLIGAIILIIVLCNKF